jgi:hypothetical protein
MSRFYDSGGSADLPAPLEGIDARYGADVGPYWSLSYSDYIHPVGDELFLVPSEGGPIEFTPELDSQDNPTGFHIKVAPFPTVHLKLERVHTDTIEETRSDGTTWTYYQPVSGGYFLLDMITDQHGNYIMLNYMGDTLMSIENSAGASVTFGRSGLEIDEGCPVCPLHDNGCRNAQAECFKPPPISRIDTISDSTGRNISLGYGDPYLQLTYWVDPRNFQWSIVPDEVTGRVLLPELTVEIPADRVREAQATAAAIGRMADHYPFVDDAGPTSDDAVEQLLSRTWRPALSVVGADGLPPTGRAGNVLRPGTRLKLSMRLPPTCDPVGAVEAMRAALVTDPPYGARVTFTGMEQGPGWNAPEFAPWLVDALDVASSATFGEPSRTFGEGGTIPFMGMLGALFPDAQFVITGVIGPDGNAHGPNEYLHVPTARHITGAVALLLDAHARRER